MWKASQTVEYNAYMAEDTLILAQQMKDKRRRTKSLAKVIILNNNNEIMIVPAEVWSKLKNLVL